MKIDRRLVLLVCILLVAGVLTVQAAYRATEALVTKVRILSRESMPLQLQIARFMESVKKASDLAGNQYRSETADQIETNGKKFQSCLFEINTGIAHFTDSTSVRDLAAQAGVGFDRLTQSARERILILKRLMESLEELANARSQALEATSQVDAAMQRLHEQSIQSLLEARWSNQRCQTQIKNLLMLLEHLGNIRTLVNGTTTTTNRYKLSLFSDKLQAETDSIRGLSLSEVAQSAQVTVLIDAVEKGMLGPNGIIELKTQMLQNSANETVRANLAAAIERIFKDLDTIRAMDVEAIDPLELLAPKNDERMIAATQTVSLTARVVDRASLVSHRVAAIDADTARLSNAATLEDSDAARRGIQENLLALRKAADEMRESLEKLNDVKALAVLAQACASVDRMARALLGRESGTIITVERKLAARDSTAKLTDAMNSLLARLDDEGTRQLRRAEASQVGEANEAEDIAKTTRKILVLGGLLVLCAGVIVGLWARHSITRTLAESDERFRQIANAITEVFWMSDIKTGATLYVSPGYERIWKRTCQSLYQDPESFIDAIHPDDRQRIVETIEKGSTTGVFDDCYRITCSDSSVAWIWDRRFPIHNESGEIVRTVGIALDITERERAKEALHQSEARCSILLDSAPEAIYGINMKGAFTFCNPACVRLLGYKTSADLLGKSAHAVIHHTRPDKSPYPERECQIYKAFRAGKETHVDNEVLWRADGTSFQAEYWSHPIQTDGNIVGAVVTFMDITARKRLEAERDDANRQLVVLSREAGKADVATSVLHNVGNVLNSVNVSATTVGEMVQQSKLPNLAKVAALLHEHAGDLGTYITSDVKGKLLPGYLISLSECFTEEQAEILKELESMMKNVGHIKDIVSMQQTYATSAGVVEIVTAETLVEDALRMNAGALTRHDVQVVREYADNPQLSVDRHKVLQILVNLIRNAKYSLDEAGRPEKLLTLRINANGNNCAKISVIDAGVGIPPQNLTKIFSRGFTTRKDGHGFGLHSASLAAKEMGGSLLAHSDGPGTGAAFVLELPLQPVEVGL